jgi:glycosyltransferase involved in cell wall biosynthesis
MTVAYILKTFPRLSQTFIVNEIRAHEAAGLDIEIFSLRRPKAEDAQADVAGLRAPVTYLGLESGPAPAGMALDRLCLEIKLRRQGPPGHAAPITHLHAHFGTSAAEAARLAARACGLPYSFTAHARDIFHVEVDAQALATRIAEARQVVTVSDFNLAHLREHFPAHAARIVRIYNGIDLRQIAPDLDSVREPLILGVGRLVEKKGFADLIDACARLTGLSCPWRCVIAGGGPLQTDLQARIDALGLADRIRLAGPQPPARVAALMRRAAVLAAPCIVGADGDRDGLPTVLLEAMALGCPVVATDVTGIPELVVEGVTGRLLRQRRPGELALALADLLHDPAGARRLALGGRDWVERHFDIHVNAERLRALFLPTVAGDAAAPCPSTPSDRQPAAVPHVRAAASV